MKTSTYWDKRALERLTESEKQSDEYIKRIKKIYERAFKNISDDIENVYFNYSKNTGVDVEKLKELLTAKETDKVWKTLKRQGLNKYIKNNYKYRISRLEQIQAQIYAKAKQIYPKEELENTMCYKGIINNSYYKAVYDTQTGTGYNFGFNKIDNNTLNSILNEKWSGKNYSERIWTNTDILADSLSTIVGGGLLSGQSIEKTTKQLRDRFNVSKYYAERLVRTESAYFHNEADAMAYEEMGVDEYVFVATLDNRTSEICQSMDNKKFSYDDRKVGENYPPLHPNCRSTTRGYLGEDVEKMLKRRARNPITGKNEIVDNMSYGEWAKNNGLLKKESSKKSIEPKEKINNNYEDITRQMLNSNLPKELPIIDLKTLSIDGEVFSVKNGKAKLNYSEDEKITAQELSKQIGGQIYMRPELENHSSADYIWQNEDWDKKTINGNGKRTIDSAIKDKQKQASRFILAMGKTEFTEEEMKEFSKKIFSTLKREWVKEIIVMNKENKIIGYYKRK